MVPHGSMGTLSVLMCLLSFYAFPVKRVKNIIHDICEICTTLWKACRAEECMHEKVTDFLFSVFKPTQ